MSEKPKQCKEVQDDLKQSVGRIASYLEEAMSSLKKAKEECLAEDWELFPPDDIENIIDKLSQMVLELRLKI